MDVSTGIIVGFFIGSILGSFITFKLLKGGILPDVRKEEKGKDGSNQQDKVTG